MDSLEQRLRTGTGLTEKKSPTGGVIRDAWVHSVMVEAADTLAAKDAEIARLRGALIEAGRAAGAFIDDTVSDNFLLLVPGEVQARLRLIDDTRADLETRHPTPPLDLTDEDALVEALARAIHEHLSRRDIMQYLDNDEDCEGIAHACLPIIRTRQAETLERAAKCVETFGRADLQPFVSEAATAWCGRKERETFSEDITYFKENWWALQGMQNFVRAAAIRNLKGEQL